VSPSLFGIAWHPGAARAIAPVVAEASRRGWRNVLATSTSSLSIVKRAGVVTHRILNTPENATAALHAMPCETVVLTGVSEGDGPEKAVIVEARGRGLPTCSVLDNWGAYEQRLTGTIGSTALPDVLAVMNDEARRGVIEGGFYDGPVLVTGHPGLDEFVADGPLPDRGLARRALGLEADRELIAFASQPIRQQCGTDYLYDQYEAFEMLMATMPESATLVVGIHPRENREDWVHRLPPNGQLLVDYDPLVFYAASDIVTSCFSASLTEAVLAGRPAISIQPRSAAADRLWTNKCGATLAAYDGPQLSRALDTARGMPEAELARRRHMLGIPSDATFRVMELIEELAAKRCRRPS